MTSESMPPTNSLSSASVLKRTVGIANVALDLSTECLASQRRRLQYGGVSSGPILQSLVAIGHAIKNVSLLFGGRAAAGNVVLEYLMDFAKSLPVLGKNRLSFQFGEDVLTV